jgi:hypothetical protein
MTPDGVRRRVEAAQVETFLLEAQDWQRLSMSEGSKGPRLFDWACVPMLHRWEDDERHWLLIRRNLADPNEKAYYFVFAPKGTTLPEMVAASAPAFISKRILKMPKIWDWITMRCAVSTSWYRHITLVLVALAFLTGICATERCSTSPSIPSAFPSRLTILPLTVVFRAPFACMAYLALSFVCLSGSGLVLVAS